MLEQMRRQGASAFIYVIFIILIAGMVYSLAPSSGSGGGGGCSPSSHVALSVDGVDANQSAFLLAYASNQASGRQKAYAALEYMTRREILAQAAEERGIRTTGDLIDRQVIENKRGYFYLGGERMDVTTQFFDDVDGEMLFNRRRWLAWIQSRNIQSAGTYREEQARGLQAAMMSELVAHSVRVSRDEALANYLYENTTATYDVVAFEAGKYRRALRLTEADTKRFLDTHGDEVMAKYKADERTYKGVKPQVELREIFIPKALAAASDEKSGSKPDDKKPDAAAKPDDKPATDKAAAKPDDKKPAAGAPKPFGLPIEAAKIKLEAVRAQIIAGKLAFADAEKQLAADSSEDAPAQNGYHGWRSADEPELGEKLLNEAIKPLKAGEMTPVIVAERGVYLAIVLAKREGDLSYDQVKVELAEKLAKETWGKEAAKRAALEALAQAQGKNLEQLYEREAPRAPSPDGLEQLMNNPQLTPEQRQQIQQMLQQQMQQKHGSLDVREADVPVAWYADADGSAGGSPAAGSAAAGSAAAGSAATGSAADATSSAAGAGTGSAAAPATPAAPAAPVVIAASKDVLPQLADVAKPKSNRFGPSPRMTKMPGLGSSKAAVDALFDDLSPGSLAKQVYEADDGTYVVMQLISKGTPKVEDFDKTAEAEIARMADARGKAAVHEWVKSRCETLAKANKIRPAPDKIQETDDKGNAIPSTYRPCMFMDMLDR